jgi:HD-like signal output (HDOD) protein
MSATEIAQDQASKILGSIAIPPRPVALTQLMEENHKDSPDLRKIGKIIGDDVGLSAAVLKTVNSPFFGLRQKISSVPQAVSVLGQRNIGNIVTGLSLRNTLGGNAASLESFWDGAGRIATVASYISARVPDVAKEEAHLFGLFRDCGIPLLMQRFPDYQDTLRLASSAADKIFTAAEEERHATSHATVGFLLARSWCLPEPVCEGILHHHDYSILDESANPAIHPKARALIAITRLAEYVASVAQRSDDDSEWLRVSNQVLDYLALSQDEVADLTEDICEKLQEN